MMELTIEKKIKNITYDESKINPKLIEALVIYHNLIKEGIMKPRENQLNKSGYPKHVLNINK